MKKNLAFIGCALCILMYFSGLSQSYSPFLSGEPLKSYESPLFGYDININDQPDQNQRNIAICSAFNGWLYAVHSYFDVAANEEAVVILRSEDNGETWAIILQGTMGVPDVRRLEIIATGEQDISNIIIIVGYLWSGLNDVSGISVVGYDRNGGILGEIFSQDPYPGNIYNFAFARDDQHPAVNSNPFSLGLLYSKRGYYKDSLIFLSASSGVYPFDKRQKISTTSRYLDKVALSYGYCPDFNSGRYFAAWEEKDDKDNPTGRIFTSHSEPYFNSAFTTPVRLDNIEPANANLAGSPVIACQNSSYNNDSANLTEIVMFETYNPSTSRYTISGVYNEKAAASNSFQPFNFVVPENNILQPDICFNPFDSTFIVTYFDSTAQKLPCYKHDVNMTNPDSWNCLSPGYNDQVNLLAPHPQAAMDFGTHTGINAWIGTGAGGNGEALFDAPFIYYTGERESRNHVYDLNARFYPNPAHEFITLELELPVKGNVEIQINNMEGREIEKFSLPDCNVGNQQFKLNLSEFGCGLYLMIIRCGNLICNKKLVVIDRY